MRLHRLAQIVSIVARSVFRPFPGDRKGRQPTRVEHEVVLFPLLSARPRLSTSHAGPSIPPAVGWVSDTPPGGGGFSGRRGLRCVKGAGARSPHQGGLLNCL